MPLTMVLLEPVRSAEPPTISGTCGISSASAAPECWRGAAGGFSAPAFAVWAAGGADAPRRRAPGQGRLGLGLGDVGVEGRERARRQVAGHGALELGLLRRGGQRRLPGLADLAAAPACGAPGADDLVREGEGFRGPDHRLAGLGDLVVEQ